MALLNKLFFPSVTSASAPSTVTTPATSTAASASSWASSASTATTIASASASVSSTNAACSSSKRQTNVSQSVHSKNYLSQFPFDGRQVRVLVYRECDSRRLLFDSKNLQKVSLKEANGNLPKGSKTAHSSNTFIEVCKEYGFKHTRPDTTDITSIGEMVFGASAMSFRGTALKVHWLQNPARILCSQVFLTPVAQANAGQSPYSTISMNSLATPRTSISSDHGSFDGLSVNSFSVPFSLSVGRHQSLTPSERSSLSYPLDVPDHQSISTTDSGPRCSSTYSTATDSGYSGTRSQQSSDQWSASYQYSTRSSLGSVMSEQSDSLRKLSMDSSYFPASPLYGALASDGSLQRRIFRNINTSFENEDSKNDLIGFLSDNYPAVAAPNGGSEGGNMGVPNYRRASYGANESRSNPEIGRRRDIAAIKANAKRAKLGMAVCITMSESFEEEMELFCSEHIALMESMLSRLRASAERAYINHKEFLQIMYEAWQETQQWIIDLFTAPRIQCPVWLSITTSGSKYSKNVADRFIKELCLLLSFADTKDTNFFISTMLTAILTHHLGWVSTVSAFNSSSLRSETAAAAIEQRAKLQQVSQKHPYNALWAQMGDLYGAIGTPPKLTRTIIYGTEELSVERLLRTLTYFIRCGEVRRSTKREDYNKQLVDVIVAENNNAILKKSSSARTGTGLKKVQASGGLTRTQTCKQNLNTINDNSDLSSGSGSGSGSDETEEVELSSIKKNEIPNVLAFRDSRFVQQELRVGNYLMDTGIEKNSLLLRQAKSSSLDGPAPIRLTLTTPDNVEMCVEDGSASSSEDGAVEAIEIEAPAESRAPPLTKRNSFFWKMVPQLVKEGLSLADVQKLKGSPSKRRLEAGRSASFSLRREDGDGFETGPSLSDLITQNSMGQGDRMIWGVEPIKEKVSLEEHTHFDQCRKQVERDHGIFQDDDGRVTFTLGDNEPLVNIKRSTEDLAEAAPPGAAPNCQTLCALHRRTHAPTHSKKHSGVKFNFEEHPQIVKNYMRSHNLDMMMDKCSQREETEVQAASMEASFLAQVPSSSGQLASAECIVCNSKLNSYQTPSNATELEYEVDDIHSYPATATSSARSLHTVSSATSVDTLKSVPTVASTATCEAAQPDDSKPSTPTPVSTRRGTFSSNSKRVCSHRGSVSSVAAKCAAVTEGMHMLKLPIPGIKELPQEDDLPGDIKLRAGFVPSLFLSVSDHYISDMVLQGTCASPTNWEMNLREDLALAAHSASLISLPAENMAIVADMDKWDVRVISSQSHCFPYAGAQSAPVGMSQLVAAMLETVQVMHSIGIPAYECLSFLESKLQEIYLHSETLAAFLLETDPCSLSDVATTLDLSENDVPLLLSIASIHSPQISKKCGISFR